MNYIVPVLQSILFYLLPIIIGRPLVKFLVKRDISLPFVSYFVTGGLALYTTLTLVYYALHTIIPTLSFTPVFYAVLILFGVVSLVLNVLAGWEDLPIKPYLQPASVSAVLAVLFTLLWQIRSPYPFNWDMLEHQTLVNQLLHGSFSFMTSHVSDTFGFNGYSTIFHTLVAVSQLVPGASMLGYWMAIDTFHFFMVIFVSYLLAATTTESKTIGYISALLAAGIFDSNVSFTSLFFIPQTFTAVVFTFLFVQLLAQIKQGRLTSWYLVAIGSVFLFLNHYVIGSVAVVAYLATILYTKYREVIAAKVNRPLILMLGLGIAVAAIFASSFISLSFLNHGEAAAYTYDFAQKFEIMREAYGFLLLIFLPLGVYLMIKTKGEIEIMMLTVAGVFLAIVMLQVPYILKYYVLAKFFIQVVLAIGIYSLIRLMKNTALQIASVVLLTIALSIIFVMNASGWKELLRYDSIYSNVAPNEVKAADFLNQHYADTGALMISDPATQQILEPLSGIDTQGGTYMSIPNRQLLDQFNNTQNATQAASLLYQINDQLHPTNGKRLLVVSDRYYLWQASKLTDKLSYGYNIWYPADLTLNDYEQLQTLIQSGKFTEVYHNPTLEVLEVQP